MKTLNVLPKKTGVLIALSAVFSCLSCNNQLKNVVGVKVYTLPETSMAAVEYGADSLNRTPYTIYDDDAFLSLLKKAKPVKGPVYSQGHIPALFLYANGDSAWADVSTGNKFFAVKGKAYDWEDKQDATDWARIIYRTWIKNYQQRFPDKDEPKINF